MVNMLLYNIFFDLHNIDFFYAVSVQALKINEFVGLKFCEEAVIRNTNTSATVTNCSVSTVGLTWVVLLVLETLFLTIPWRIPLKQINLAININIISTNV